MHNKIRLFQIASEMTRNGRGESVEQYAKKMHPIGLEKYIAIQD